MLGQVRLYDYFNFFYPAWPLLYGCILAALERGQVGWSRGLCETSGLYLYCQKNEC